MPLSAEVKSCSLWPIFEISFILISGVKRKALVRIKDKICSLFYFVNYVLWSCRKLVDDQQKATKFYMIESPVINNLYYFYCESHVKIALFLQWTDIIINLSTKDSRLSLSFALHITGMIEYNDLILASLRNIVMWNRIVINNWHYDFINAVI